MWTECMFLIGRAAVAFYRDQYNDRLVTGPSSRLTSLYNYKWWEAAVWERFAWL
jgi:hypothetical protein